MSQDMPPTAPQAAPGAPNAPTMAPGTTPTDPAPQNAAQHLGTAAGQDTPRGQCTGCGRDIGLTAHGLIWHHGDPGRRCPGSGQAAAGATTTSAQDDTRTPPTRCVCGHLRMSHPARVRQGRCGVAGCPCGAFVEAAKGAAS